MDLGVRRKVAGRRIRRARERLDITQRELADQLGVDEKSISNVERGSDRVSVRGKLFGKIEDALSWPEDCIARYLETGDESLLPSTAAGAVPARPALTAEQKELLRVYREEYVPKYGEDEAQRRLQQDIDVLNAAIEREHRSAG